MDVTGKYIIVEKHRKLKGKLARRRFSDETDMEKMIELATGYAAERGQDFLIVQVVTDVSKPNSTTGDQNVKQQ